LDLELTPPDDPAPLSEPDDMRAIEFSCHPEMPVKVTEDWSRAVHCPRCGKLSWDAV
jgi:hypothetical protein